MLLETRMIAWVFTLKMEGLLSVFITRGWSVMSLNVDWEKLRRIHDDLLNHSDLKPESDITFLMILTNGRIKKSVVKFKDFLGFFWAVSENNELKVVTLVCQDSEGRIIYRQKQVTRGNEEIPDGGHSGIIQNWEALTQQEKQIYIRILLAQIEGYEK